MIIETVDYTIKDGSEIEFETIFPILQKCFATVPGCLNVRLLRDTKETTTFLLLMEWESQAALDAMRNDPSFDEWRTRSRTLTSAPSRPRFYTETA